MTTRQPGDLATGDLATGDLARGVLGGVLGVLVLANLVQGDQADQRNLGGIDPSQFQTFTLDVLFWIFLYATDGSRVLYLGLVLYLGCVLYGGRVLL